MKKDFKPMCICFVKETENGLKYEMGDHDVDLELSITDRKIAVNFLYFNNKNKRTGMLWEGNFKAEHVVNDNYLKYLFSYIHLNPIKLIQTDWKEKGIKNMGKAKSFLKNYKYSSLPNYVNTVTPSVTVNRESFLKALPKNLNLEKEIWDWLKFKK